MRGRRVVTALTTRPKRSRCAIVVSRCYVTAAPHNPIRGDHSSSPPVMSVHETTNQERVGGMPEDHGEASHHGSEHDNHDHHGTPWDKHRAGWTTLTNDFPNYNVTPGIPGTSYREQFENPQRFKYLWDPFHIATVFPDVYTKEGKEKLKSGDDHGHEGHDDSHYDPWVARTTPGIFSGLRKGEIVWDLGSDLFVIFFIGAFLFYYIGKTKFVAWNWRQWSLIELQRRAQDKYENNSQGKFPKFVQLEVPVSRFPKIPLVPIWNHVPNRRFEDAEMSVLCRGAEMRNPNYLTPKKEVEEYRAKQRALWEKRQSLKQKSEAQ